MGDYTMSEAIRYLVGRESSVPSVHLVGQQGSHIHVLQKHGLIPVEAVNL